MANLLALSVILWSGALVGGDTVQQGADQGIYQRSSIQDVENRLSIYLNGEVIKSILTPGEVVEWKQNLKAGQVLVADASSEAFDPALEIVSSDDKVLAVNDDRYPGDQRPLLFWHCDKDGEYRLRARCFQNKSGGQVFVRFKTYETVDIPTSGQMVEAVVDATKPFLLRIPMKGGQLKDVVSEKMGDANYINYSFSTVIFPNGLPERNDAFSVPLSPAIRALVAPLEGDYYLLESPYGYRGGNGRIRVGTRDIVPKPISQEGDGSVLETPTNYPTLVELPVKAGQFLEVSMPELNIDCSNTLSEAPDFSKYAIDPKKPELNPFFPPQRNQPPGPGPAFDLLPKRARDNRLFVFRVRRDAKLWIASNGAGPAGKQFTVRVAPAALTLAEGTGNAGRLKIANTDYWAFDAKAGDVMSLGLSAHGFAPLVLVRDPDLAEIRHWEAPLDQNSDTWRMIVQKPGRYLVAVAGQGNGASGEYSLSRRDFHAKDFSKSSPAKGEISGDQIQIWKFTAVPNDPILIHWSSTDWGYDVSVYDDKGNPTGFQNDAVDEHNRFGILKVDQPRTYVVVLTGRGPKASYSIELGDIPGYGKPVAPAPAKAKKGKG